MPEKYSYVLSDVPSTCSQYRNGQVIELWFAGDPPKSMVMNYGSTCDNITATLVEE